MSSLPSGLLAVVFLLGALATWVAGVSLSKTTDALDSRLGLGEDLGGIVLLAVAGSLPELAITVSAAAQGKLGVAAGNLIGGIAVQTMVLAVCDATAGRERPLTFLVGALTPVLEGLLVVLVVAAVLMGALLGPHVAIGGVVSPASLAIVVLWALGVYTIDRVRKDPRWSVSMPGGEPGRRHRREKPPEKPHPYASASTLRVAMIFLAACLVTLGAGVVLTLSGSTLADRAGMSGVVFGATVPLADRAGMSGVVFGATVLATVTALPEISSGIAAVRLGDNALAIGDIFGGNAFQLCLFLVADLIAGTPVLTTAGEQNSWLAALGVALTAIYSVGVIVRPGRCLARLGPDSVLAIVVFGLGIAGLVTLSS